MKKLILVLVVVMMTSAFLSADVYIKQETKSSGIPGQEAKTATSEQWMSKDKMVSLTGDQKIILNLGAKKAYFIDLTKKTFVEASLPLDNYKLMKPEAVQMMKMVSDGMTATVNPNNKTQKIGNWNCKGYDAVITVKIMGSEMNTKMTIWTSTEIPFDWKTYAPMQEEIAKFMMKSGEKIWKEFKKIDGVQIATDMNFSQMGQTIKISTNVIEIDPNKTAPADLYTLPAGFTKNEFIEAQMGM